MKIGLFGGTFDPVHLGHLILAEHCRDQANLDAIWFIPAARPPHKNRPDLTAFDRRVEMLQLAIAGHDAFRIELVEKDRPGPSYTSDTVQQLRQRYPQDAFHLILGSDSLHDLPSWHEPQALLNHARLIVVARPGHEVDSEAELGRSLGLDRPLQWHLVTMPLIEIASREVRRRVSEGRSIRYLVPRAVEMYIHEKRLYQSTA